MAFSSFEQAIIDAAHQNPQMLADLQRTNPQLAERLGLMSQGIPGADSTPGASFQGGSNGTPGPTGSTPGTVTGTLTVPAPGNGWSSVTAGSADALLQRLLGMGTSGQQAADLVNAQFPGTVVYYDNFKGSGHSVYGLPKGYVTNEGGGWNYVPRGNESGSGSSTLSSLSSAAGAFNPTVSAFTPQTFTPTPFVAPTGVDMTNDPGYQFRLDQGNKAYQQSAAAKGTLLTGGTLKGANDYAQNAASNEYGNVFNRALQANQTNNGYQLSATQANNSSGLAANQNNYNQALTTHQTNYSDLFNLANLGYQATTSTYQ